MCNADNEDNSTDYYASDVEEDNTNSAHEFESEWEVSDFSSCDDSCDDWMPWKTWQSLVAEFIMIGSTL